MNPPEFIRRARALQQRVQAGMATTGASWNSTRERLRGALAGRRWPAPHLGHRMQRASALWRPTQSVLARLARDVAHPAAGRVDAALEPLRWPDRWSGWRRGPLASLDPSSRVLAVAIAASVLLHAMVLAIHFKFPDAIRQMSSQTLEVVLVNSKTRQKPVKPAVLAQANLDGGGNTDENRRAKTPLPVLPKKKVPGRDVVETQQRVKELEAQQRQVLTQLQAKAPAMAPAAPEKPVPEEKPQISGADLVSRSLAIARLEAQISRSIDDYNKRPRKKFIGARASEYRFAQYVEDWRVKVERIGNINYPEAARGKMYGRLVLEVSIKPDGDVESVYVTSGSGYPVLDRAAERIVRMAGPYAPFPPAVRKDTDILVITRTWHFAPGDRLFGE